MKSSCLFCKNSFRNRRLYLPPEGCSTPRGSDDEKAVRWSCETRHDGRLVVLRQFMYTKFVIVCDDDVNARDWNDAIWAITTRMHPARIRCWLKIRRLITFILPRRSPRAGFKNGAGCHKQMAGRNPTSTVPLLKILKLPRAWMRIGDELAI